MKKNNGTLDEAVSIRSADKVFNPDSDDEVQALSGINLDIASGDFISLIGPSGSANIELPLELKGWSKSERKVRSKEMLELVRLEEFGDHYPRQLSGGMQQRVSIARALSFEPRLLLMDEPFGALDEMTREHMQVELLRIWRETGTTVVFVTHSIPEAAFLSSRVVVLSPRPGKIHSEIEVNLGDRTDATREDPQFFQATTEVREALRAVEASE